MGFTMGVATLGLKATAAAAAKNPERNGNCRDICCEAGEERYSRTITCDPSRSDLNGHLGRFSSGVDAYEYIRSETEKAEEIHRAKSKQGRGFRKDKSIAYAFIFKPDSEWVDAQDKATLDAFFDDAFATACELGVFDENTDVVLRERHYDEAAAHEHVIVMAKTADGDLAGPEFLGLKKFDLLNHELPKKLREMGWDIDELGRNYDAEKAKQMTPEELIEYKAECIEKKRAKHGLSANEYIAKKRAAQETERAAKAIEIANEAEEHAERAESNARLREKARDEMRAEVDALWEQKQQAKADADTAKAEQKAAEAARDKAARELTDMEPRIKAVGKRETDVKAREASVKKREESVAASERDIAVKQTQADAVLAAARRDAEAVGRRIEEEAERRADETEQKAAERAAAMLDEAEQLSTAEDATESFLRFARGQMDRGDYYALRELYDQWQAERQAGDDERARRTARLRSQVDDIQRRGRGGEGYGF